MAEGMTDEFICATYRALCKHGYATMQDIADESTTGKAPYDTNQGLLRSFPSSLYERFEYHLRAPESAE